jgi:hypothetical protein
MKIDRLLALGFATGISFVVFEGFANLMASAKPIPLTDLKCMEIKGSAGFNDTKKEIVLNREIYTSLFNFATYADQEFACKLPNAKSASLDLELTIPSDKGGPSAVSIYLNGNQIISEKVFPGKVTLIKEPLTARTDTPYQVGGRRTIVFETTCLHSSGCLVHFLKGNLNIVSNPGAKE